jgi:hypothetical protein
MISFLVLLLSDFYLSETDYIFQAIPWINSHPLPVTAKRDINEDPSVPAAPQRRKNLLQYRHKSRIRKGKREDMKNEG